jgi:Xaa-Pro dipeptidase
MHLLSEKVMLEGLVELGLIEGDVKEMLDGRVGFIFQPHGLGHFIGLDVHDVGGYLAGTPERSTKPGLKNLRCGRVLEKGMCLTIEPGCYFRNFLLNGELEGGLDIELKYLKLDKIKEYQAEVAGIRIEDCVLITENGCELLSNMVPRTTEEIELCMAGKEW